ncbi:hypothetical protein [Corallococcus macrosporus]|uniref:PEGA domain-containing protein n=1 Tax=Corallococcus macrosporus DSM 14697 TaxID=1189310 RepID=A0A250JN78_9BACT|nr:hypothetical protein [Corallococcus macrosporus]ATB45319.1 hypothetical protein MYMAC_000904 [Corallococcus macrosporus DSM 14697]
MRISVAPVTALLALALLAAPSWAQEQGGLGLDLTSDAPAEQPGMGMGLDLRPSNPDADLLPRFALVGLYATERAGAQQAPAWLEALARGALATAVVAQASDLHETQERLAEGHDAAVRCAEAACFAEPAELLDADLLTTARLSLEDAGWTLRTWTYDRDRRAVHEDAVTGRNPGDEDFMNEAAAMLSRRLTALARPRAMLTVNVNVPQAVVKVGERIIGVGSVEVRQMPGKVVVEVSADEYGTRTRTLDLQPGARETVEVMLEISGPAPEGPPDEDVAGVASSRKGPGKSLFKRPALYTALLGLAAVGAGVVMGLSAKDVEKRAGDADGDGVFDVTRQERLDAQSQANLATALLVGGGAVTAGSVAWLVLVPARGAPTSLSPGTGGGASTSLHLMVGGSF